MSELCVASVAGFKVCAWCNFHLQIGASLSDTCKEVLMASNAVYGNAEESLVTRIVRTYSYVAIWIFLSGLVSYMHRREVHVDVKPSS